VTELWLATGNEKKRAELERGLQPFGLWLRLQTELPGYVAPAEDQPSFAGNAVTKACALARAARRYALADDSGLCVDALGGRPGVQSARYAGEAASDRERVRKLLAELRDVPPERRSAHFVCALALARPDGSLLASFERRCDGVLLEAPRGQGGFGYDPLFVALAHAGWPGRPTFAELEPAQKDAVSHRGQALAALIAWLETHPLP
jgi:XTP/dITP diphosphohydrolase